MQEEKDTPDQTPATPPKQCPHCGGYFNPNCTKTNNCLTVEFSEEVAAKEEGRIPEPFTWIPKWP